MVSRGGRARQLTHGPLSLPGHAGVGGTLANDHRGFTGTWETLPFPLSNAGWRRRYTNSRMIHGPTSRADGDEQGTQGWYRQAKETKRGEMDGKESQCPIVVLKRGNGPPGPRGAKGVPRCGRGVGTTPRIPCLSSVSPRNHPVVWGTAIPQCDEPGAFNVHARICGSSRE